MPATNITVQRMAPTLAPRAVRPTPVDRDIAPNRRTSPKKARRQRVLVVCRESAKDAYSEFGKMLENILAGHHNLPGAATILGFGSKLVERTPEGDALRKQLNAEPKYVAGGRVVVGWLFDIDGTLFFLGLHSAGKPTIKVDSEHNLVVTNEFTRALASVVTQHNVNHIVTGPLSRLLRSRNVAADLRQAMVNCETTIKCSDQPMPFDMGSQAGQQSFDLAAWFVEESYRQIVQGLTNGTHRMLLRGQYPKAEHQLPGMGYKFLSEDDHTPVPDLKYLPIIRDVITWAAEDPAETSWADIAKRLADKHKWASETLRRRDLDDPNATIMDAAQPGTAVRNMLGACLDVWETGLYLYDITVPANLARTMLLDDAHAFLLDDDDGEDEDGEAPGGFKQRRLGFNLSFHHELLPDGRWVEPELIAKARQRFDRSATLTGRAATKEDKKPLGGVVEWDNGTDQFRLHPAGLDVYWLVRRPLTEATNSRGVRKGWPRDLRHNLVATVKCTELHRAVADSIVAALAGKPVGVSRAGTGEAISDSTGDPDTISAELQQVNATLAALETERADAREAGLKRVQLRIANEMETLLDRQEQLQAELTVAAAAQAERRPLAAQTAQVGELIASLAQLAECGPYGPAELNSTLRRVIARMELTLSDNELVVDVNTWVRLITDDGPLVAGPIACSVPNARCGELTQRRYARATEYILADGMRDIEAMQLSGYTGLNAMRVRVSSHIEDAVPSRYLRSAIIDCPIAETKRVVWEMVRSKAEQRPFNAPRGLDPAFVRHIRNTYSDDTRSWALSWAAQNHRLHRAVLDYVSAGGADGVRSDDLLEYMARMLPGSMPHFRGLVYRGKANTVGENYDPLVDKGERFHSKNPDRRVLARRCPYCDTRTLTHPIRVPEVPGGLLCTTCRRCPYLPSVVFPVDYMRDWDGPRGLGDGQGSERNTGTWEHGMRPAAVESPAIAPTSGVHGMVDDSRTARAVRTSTRGRSAKR